MVISEWRKSERRSEDRTGRTMPALNHKKGEFEKNKKQKCDKT